MQHFYVGTWKSKNIPGKILVYEKENETATRKVQEIVLGESVAKIEVDQKNNLLFAVLETRERSAGSCGGDVCVFRILQDGTLREVKRLPSYGAYPIDFVINGSFIAVVNHGSTTGYICRTRIGTNGIPEVYREYDESSLVVFECGAGGIPETFLDLKKFEGKGNIPFFQNSASPHSISFTQTGMYLVPERGTDQTTIFTLEKKKLIKKMILCAPKGSGPRNASVSRDGIDVYIITEIEPLLLHYRITGDLGRQLNGTIPKIEPLQQLRTISSNTEEMLDRNPQSFAAAHPSGIKMSEDEKWLYVLTRSSNTLSIFERRAEDGSLEFAGEWRLSGKNPRELLVKKDGLYITLLDSKTCVKLTIGQNGMPVSEDKVLLDIPYLATVDIQ